MLASLASSLGISTRDLWYVSRASGLMLLVLLSAAVVLGVVVRSGWTPRSTLRFVVEGLHRNIALLCVGLLVVHVVTAELDPYVTLGWAAAIVPFTSPYRSLWIGLGALSLDLFLAVVVTSLFRRFIGVRLWRAVHYISYGAWPVAFVHSLKSGTDTTITWVDVTMWACAGVVVLAVAARLAGEKPGGRWSRRAVAKPGPAPATVPLP
ncbi:MAG: ferric reductase, partial [Acidimicrobiaceae bacterium]|nr:ferric reductase [Acidimicrobiaceae bacterium]